MIIDSHSLHRDVEVAMAAKHWDGKLLAYELLISIASQLEVPTIDSEAEGECARVNGSRIKRLVVNWTLFSNIPCLVVAHAEDAVRLLSVEQVGLLLNAAEDELEALFVRRIRAEIYDVLYHESVVRASFRVADVEVTLVVCRARAGIAYIVITIENSSGGRGVEIEPWKVMLAAGIRLAVAIARHGSDPTTCVDYERLGLSI